MKNRLQMGFGFKFLINQWKSFDQYYSLEDYWRAIHKYEYKVSRESFALYELLYKERNLDLNQRVEPSLEKFDQEMADYQDWLRTHRLPFRGIPLSHNEIFLCVPESYRDLQVENTITEYDSGRFQNVRLTQRGQEDLVWLFYFRNEQTKTRNEFLWLADYSDHENRTILRTTFYSELFVQENFQEEQTQNGEAAHSRCE